MKKYLLFAVLLFSVGFFVPDVLAKNDENVKKFGGKISEATPENPVVYLGKQFDKKKGEFVDGYAIVHYAKSYAKPAKSSPADKCYGFISKGAKWKGVEGWVVDQSINVSGLDAAYVKAAMQTDIGTWESAAFGKNILGDGNVGQVSSTLGSVLDNKNEVAFGKIQSPGAIAVTYIWGNFGGKVSQKVLVEWDQAYSTDFSWSPNAEIEKDKMDFEDIATHELGHSVGMGDLYNSSCSSQTMYGYASEGETNKRSLENGDITGIRLLYQ